MHYSIRFTCRNIRIRFAFYLIEAIFHVRSDSDYRFVIVRLAPIEEKWRYKNSLNELISATISTIYQILSRYRYHISDTFHFASIIKISLFLCVSFEIGKVERCSSQNRERAISPFLEKFTDAVSTKGITKLYSGTPRKRYCKSRVIK